MNLYLVREGATEFVSFVFAANRNHARYIHCIENKETDYCKVRTKLVGKTDKVDEPALVDDERHPLYPIVKELGEYYNDPNTGEEL